MIWTYNAHSQQYTICILNDTDLSTLHYIVLEIQHLNYWCELFIIPKKRFSYKVMGKLDFLKLKPKYFKFKIRKAFCWIFYFKTLILMMMNNDNLKCKEVNSPQVHFLKWDFFFSVKIHYDELAMMTS